MGAAGVSAALSQRAKLASERAQQAVPATVACAAALVPRTQKSACGCGARSRQAQMVGRYQVQQAVSAGGRHPQIRRCSHSHLDGCSRVCSRVCGKREAVTGVEQAAHCREWGHQIKTCEAAI